MSIDDSQSTLLQAAAEVLLQQELSEHRRVFEATALMLDQPFVEALDILHRAVRGGGKLLLFGNGGSAADAQHLAAELSGRFYTDRDALPAEALHCNTSYLTAVANDYSYDVIYARLIKGIANEGDVLVGLSTSGNSTNIFKAFEMAKQKGLITVGFTGESGGKIKACSDFLINIPSTDTPRIQESHILVGHIICQLVEEEYFG
ncbi:MAG TPA: D-sedoheptulose 7-phosphate isomerase [Puia sp.]|nr:D-sedoheptulose 7-phosphate isomerase [Puia sp.]